DHDREAEFHGWFLLSLRRGGGSPPGSSPEGERIKRRHDRRNCRQGHPAAVDSGGRLEKTPPSPESSWAGWTKRDARNRLNAVGWPPRPHLPCACTCRPAPAAPQRHRKSCCLISIASGPAARR